MLSENDKGRQHALGMVLMCLATLAWVGCRGDDVDRRFTPANEGETFEVDYNLPLPGMGLETPTTNRQGEPVEVRCGTCHRTMGQEDGSLILTAPEAYHSDIELEHGTLTCRSCHTGGDAELFILANGQTLDAPQGATLCGQCHSVEYRHYTNGTHGGMNGYWDLTRGARQRNDCVVCHSPHHPAFPQFNPAPGPQDRFLVPSAHSGI